MKYKKATIYFSPPRLERYLIAAKNNKQEALKLYKSNLKVAQAFHPLLGLLEVSLRNSLNEKLSDFFSDEDWIINQKNGFMSDPGLTFIDKKTSKKTNNYFLKNSIEKSEKRFIRLGKSITSGKIIADQSLGFWTDLFEIHHYKILKGRPIQIFKSLPPQHGRSEVCERLNKIRLFRNRIQHNEPICFDNRLINFNYSEEIHSSILDILNWIDPDLTEFINKLDNVKFSISRAKSKFN